MGRYPVIPYKDEKARRASSVPNIHTSPHTLHVAYLVKFSSEPEVTQESDSNKDDWSESTLSNFSIYNAVILEDIFAPLPNKRKHTLKRYLMIFLVMITLLSITPIGAMQPGHSPWQKSSSITVQAHPPHPG
eukprot:TRINITY_DN52944_c0_g1_i1.p1 TRINITY_DN52944_c0_g1~~TRINITY_DN52944_c0_g1_i1.p1  ORF type:complete len:132 (-),score=29.86 TRINITY_DN52944_c0_g1_i1:312-707(-)